MEGFLALKRLRDWLEQHPGWVIVDTKRRLSSNPLHGALYHSEDLAIFASVRDTYILAPLVDTDDLPSQLARLVDEETGYDLSSTAAVIELIDELLDNEREQS